MIDEKFETDLRVTPFHISLYFALFIMWNKSKFANPLTIRRDEIKLKAKISSNNSYSKFIKELADYGFIKYFPSTSWVIGSRVEFIVFEDSTYITKDTSGNISRDTSTRIDNDTSRSTSDNTSHVRVVRPLLNNINKNKTKEILKTLVDNCDHKSENKKSKEILLFDEVDKGQLPIVQKEKKATPQNIEEVQTYFLEKKYAPAEAEKFYNYYESNGWMVGKNKMRNWKAAASNWISNSGKFQKNNSKEKTTYLHINQDKDYSIPL